MERTHPIEAVLDARGSSKRWLAAQLEMHETQLAHIIAGRRKPSDTFYKDAAKLLGVPEAMLRPVAAEPTEAAA